MKKTDTLPAWFFHIFKKRKKYKKEKTPTTAKLKIGLIKVESS